MEPFTESLQGYFALTGEIGGSRRHFVLHPGSNRIGSLCRGDVVLDARGVSKRHAIVSVGSDRIVVEDLASKNGTFVNGERVERRALELRDEIGFGPVSLRLETISSLDGELGIELPIPLPQAESPERLRETSILPEERSSRAAEAWLVRIERLTETLFSGTSRGLTASLARVTVDLNAEGACLLEIGDDRCPMVLSCHGNPKVTTFAGDYLASTELPEVGDIRVSRLDHEGGALTVAVLAPHRTPYLVLLVWSRPLAIACNEAYLRAVLRLVHRLRESSEGEGIEEPTGGSSRLVFPKGYLPGTSAPMTALYSQMKAVAGTEVPTLILGETGTGKDWVARILHESSPRAKGPFLAINCAAIPGELLEAELFGIGRRVATGVEARQGKFQMAGGGTLFLDEIGDMPGRLQAKLLRALEEKQVHPVGSAPMPVDVRLIAATNTVIDETIAYGRFRRDLYYRLAGFVLKVPPLRERQEDLPGLIEHFLRLYSREAEKSIRGLTLAALRSLCRREWPGNVREMEHEVRRLVYLCPQFQAIDRSTLSAAAEPGGPLAGAAPTASSKLSGPGAQTAAAGNAQAEPAFGPGALDPSRLESLELGEVERVVVQEAIRRCRGNRTRAAQLLKISREALRRRLLRFGLKDYMK